MKKTTSRFALAAAAGLFAGGLALTPASAADLGGDCCADLEERVAELEATVVRKGNKMQSVELSGHVNRAIIFYDDGAPDTYVPSTRVVAPTAAQLNNALVASATRNAQLDAAQVTLAGANTQINRNRVNLRQGQANAADATLAALQTRQATAGQLVFANAGQGVWEGSGLRFVDNGTASTRFRVRGSAAVNESWSIGYVIELGVYSNRTLNQVDNRFSGRDGASQLGIRVADIWFQTPIGRITTGFGPYASEGIAQANLGGTGGWFGGGTGDWFSGGTFRNAAGASSGVTIGALMNEHDGFRDDRIRYTSPTFYGFTLHADYGYVNVVGGPNEEAAWDVGVTFAKEFNSIRVAAAIGYIDTENPDNAPAATNDASEWAGSISVMHVPSGIFVNFGMTELDSGIAGAADAGWWRVQAGINKRFFSLGNTILTGEYAETDDQLFANAGGGLDGSNWGIGIQQNVDAAATELYVGVRVYELDSNVYGRAICGGVACEDIVVGIAGARVKF